MPVCFLNTRQKYAGSSKPLSNAISTTVIPPVLSNFLAYAIRLSIRYSTGVLPVYSLKSLLKVLSLT